MESDARPAVEPRAIRKITRTFQNVIRKSMMDVGTAGAALAAAGVDSDSFAALRGDGEGGRGGDDDDDDDSEFSSDGEESDQGLAYLENEGNRYIRKCELVLQKSREIDSKIKNYKQRLDWLERKKKAEEREAARRPNALGGSAAGTKRQRGGGRRLAWKTRLSTRGERSAL